MVETLCEVACHLKVLELILAYRHEVGFVLEDVGCHEHRVGEEACIDIVRLLACLVLERYCLLELAEIGVHIEQGVEFAGLWHIALDVDDTLVRVHACCKILCEDAAHVRVEHRRVGLSSQ